MNHVSNGLTLIESDPATLTDTAGNLLDLGTDKTCICQFNFSDFDASSHGKSHKFGYPKVLNQGRVKGLSLALSRVRVTGSSF
ncbi:hypothetical protein RJ640_017523 [Escallonia rubra]|uniref:Uncharacterized protein n=1 Tax=Escallonia rubra TaxID=112253 RepID=A0AA88UBT1_9ASTE|nr:hypothetical protein RJ640_017523 [Escallonia rubra]